jgi:hypothetical protein
MGCLRLLAELRAEPELGLGCRSCGGLCATEYRYERDPVFETGCSTSEDGTGVGLSIGTQMGEVHG